MNFSKEFHKQILLKSLKSCKTKEDVDRVKNVFKNKLTAKQIDSVLLTIK